MRRLSWSAPCHSCGRRSRVVVLHYSPIVGTVEGEAPKIYPFLGTSPGRSSRPPRRELDHPRPRPPRQARWAHDGGDSRGQCGDHSAEIAVTPGGVPSLRDLKARVGTAAFACPRAKADCHVKRTEILHSPLITS